MSIADKLVTVYENQQKVFDAGKEAKRQAFWSALQNKGKRTDYSYAFYKDTWLATFQECPPVYDIKPKTSSNMFNGWNTTSKTLDLVEFLEECGVTLDFSDCTSFNRTFESNTSIGHVGVMDIRKGTNFTNTFAYAGIDTIDKMIVDENLDFSAIFTYYSTLKNITFEGNIGKALNMSACKNLTNASAESVIYHLKDLTGATSLTIKFHADVTSALTAEQKAEITRRNWTLAT